MSIASNRRSLLAALAAGCLLVAAVAVVLVSTGPRERSHAVAREQLFSPTSVWNAPLPRDATVDPRSQAMTAWLLAQVQHEFADGPDPEIEGVSDSTPIYRVTANQRPVPVTLENDQPWARTLARALRAVPIPADARPSPGPDQELTIYQPATDRLWELWEARRTPRGWEAKWGGAMDDVRGSPGYFSSRSWPGAESYWGASATSLPLAGGTMLIGQLERGQIDHALAIALPYTRADEYAWPAQRTDGTDPDPNAIPEGARLRLDPSLDIARLHLPPVVRAVAVAAQRYGMIVRDQTGGEAVAFYAETPTTGVDPYSRIFGGVAPYDLLKYFPWRYLEVLRMRLRHGSGSP